MREFSNHAVLSMSDSTMAVSSKYTQDLCVQIVFFTFSLCFLLMGSLFLLLGCNLNYIADLCAALHELTSASARTLLKLAPSVRVLLKLYGDTLLFNLPVYILCNVFSAMWVFQLKFSSINTPRDFVEDTCSMGKLLIVRDGLSCK